VTLLQQLQAIAAALTEILTKTSQVTAALTDLKSFLESV
jgi:hypothetical protein